MKLYVNCWQCAFDDDPDMTRYPVQVNDSGIMEFACNRNHRAIVQLYDDLYELLFDSGASALYDGYPREAVTSFATAVERFYEYVTKLVLIANGIEKSLLEEVWKDISRRSECQLGAFRFTYLLNFKVAPPEMPPHCIRLRNDVTHKGKFPSQEEAMGYGQSCLDHIETIFKLLRDSKHSNAMQDMTAVLAKVRRSEVPAGHEPLRMIRRGIIYYVLNPEPEKLTLAAWVEQQQRDQNAHERWSMWQMVKDNAMGGYLVIESPSLALKRENPPRSSFVP